MIILMIIQFILGFLIWRASRKLYEFRDFDEEDRIKFPLIAVILFGVIQFLPVVGLVLDIVLAGMIANGLIEKDCYYKHSKLGLKIKNFLFKQI